VAPVLEAIGSAAIEQALAAEATGAIDDQALEAATALVAPATAAAAWLRAGAARLTSGEPEAALLAACFAVDAVPSDLSALALLAECAAQVNAPDIASAVASVVRAQAIGDALIDHLDELIATNRSSRLSEAGHGDQAMALFSDAETWRETCPARFMFGKVLAASGANPAWGGIYDLAFYVGNRGATDLAIALLDGVAQVLPDFGTIEIAHSDWLKRTGQYTAMLERRNAVMTRSLQRLVPPQPEARGPFIVAAASDGAEAAALAALRQQGFVVLKGAIDPSVIAQTAAVLFTDDPDRPFVAPCRDIPADLLGQLIAPLPRQILQSLQLEGPDDATSHGRQLLPSLDQPRDGLASEYHQDALIFFQPLLNVWIPLDPCGQDAPTLALLPDRTRRMLPTRHRDHFSMNSGLISDAAIAAILEHDQEYLPILEIGDVLMFLGSVPHRTHITPQMTKRRRSLELRFAPAQWLMQPMQSN
jgi:hypothetical protein